MRELNKENIEGIRLERAAFDDINSILDIEKGLVGTKIYSGLTGAEDAEKELSENIYFTIKKNGKIVGDISYQIKDDGSAYISGLAVAKEMQRQGIAKQAMQILLEILKDKKIIWLVTHPKNHKAIGLYGQFGFRQVGKAIANYFNDGEPRIKMILNKNEK